jgi:serine/threonine protein kinase
MPSQANQPLQDGTQLQNYRIVRLLASGGFSFVYLAHDENGSPVAVKEYLPSTLALRTGDSAHPKVPDEDMASFRFGLKCFFEEGRALAMLVHPNVVRVLNFFRANETVYLVMRYERGRTLHEHIKRRQGALAERWIRGTFAQLLNGLREVHSNKLLHLDIKPANVYVRNDGTPLLIDFGAARQTLSAGRANLPPTFTPGFASPEQHTRGEELGPWSDIYSVGATLYACLAATAPQPASSRLEKDALVPARRLWAGKYSAELLDTVDWCLRLKHRERPQSVFALQKALLGEREPGLRSETPIFEHIKAAFMRLARRGGSA